MQQVRYMPIDTQATADFADLDIQYGDRVEAMLAHWLDDEDLAARLRRPIMSAVSRRSETLGLRTAELEDWIFGEARREARELVGPARIPGVIPVMRTSQEEDRPQSIDDVEDWDEPPARRRWSVPPRWLWFGAFLIVMSGAIGYASLTPQDDPRPDIASAPPAPVVAPPAPAALPSAPVTAAIPAPVDVVPPTPPALQLPALDAEADGAPMRLPPPAPVLPAPSFDALEAPAPEPPPDVLPMLAATPPPLLAPTDLPAPTPGPSENVVLDPPTPPAPPAPPAQASAAPLADAAPARVFIHYSTVEGSAAGRANQLANILRDQDFTVVAIRRVPFQIDRPSVRYFFEENLPAADRLVQLSSRVLPPNSGLQARGPTDFTHFDPKPQPGTVEIWLPTG